MLQIASRRNINGSRVLNYSTARRLAPNTGFEKLSKAGYPLHVRANSMPGPWTGIRRRTSQEFHSGTGNQFRQPYRVGNRRSASGANGSLRSNTVSVAWFATASGVQIHFVPIGRV